MTFKSNPSVLQGPPLPQLRGQEQTHCNSLRSPLALEGCVQGSRDQGLPATLPRCERPDERGPRLGEHSRSPPWQGRGTQAGWEDPDTDILPDGKGRGRERRVEREREEEREEGEGNTE